MANSKIVALILMSVSTIDAVSMRSCSDLMNEDNQPFDYFGGQNQICAATRVPVPGGNAKCHRANINHEDAKAACEHIGARLCSFDEIQAEMTYGAGCGLDDNDPQDWCYVSDSGCGEDKAFVSKCASSESNSKKCVSTQHFPGSLKCCADGKPSVDPKAICREHCAQYDCGLDCKNDYMTGSECQCGWSSPKDKCVPYTGANGRGTNKKEELMGPGCVEQELSKEVRQKRCKEHVCGAECARDRLCGWSTARGKCVPGAVTKKKELTMGDCSGVDISQFVEPDCAQYKCGVECAKHGGCGWSQSKEECMPGHSTSPREMMMGDCTIEQLSTIKNYKKKYCQQFTCGDTCANAPQGGCGWSASRNKCIPGVQTSSSELRLGQCEEDVDNCGQYKCAMDCYSSPNCGWSSKKMQCRKGSRTSKSELEMCEEQRIVEPKPTPPPTTASPVLPPSTLSPTPAPVSTCDDYKNWKDSEGDGCDMYAEKHWCTPDGKPGSGWAPGDSFQRYAKHGIDALKACCACGGGKQLTPEPSPAPTTKSPTPHPTTQSPTPYPTMPCQEKPKNWVDIEGDSCQVYKASGWCTEDGGYGPNWGNPPELGGESFEQYAVEGKTAIDACCECGGGFFPGRPTPKPTPRPTDEPKEIEVMKQLDEFPLDGKFLGNGVSKIGGKICDHRVTSQRIGFQPSGSGHSAERCIKWCLDKPGCNFATLTTKKGFCRLLHSCNHHASLSGISYEKVLVVQ